MLCYIADLKTSVPATGDMVSRCREYVIPGSDGEAQIALDETQYRFDRWPGAGEDMAVYMESAAQFYRRLLDFDGMMLHASATVIDGAAYLFAGQCGIGKSTHAELLRGLFSDARLINDDKPALRRVDGRWYAYGTPWSGKHGINLNEKWPLQAICLLTTRRDRNDIRPADPLHAVTGVVSCTTGRNTRELLLKLTPVVDRLIREVPIYEMDSLADGDAARMAYDRMKNGKTE